MSIKSQKKNRAPISSKESPQWDKKNSKENEESVDARIGKMNMMMASAERSGFRGKRSDLYSGLPPALLWSIRIGACALVIGGISAIIVYSKAPPPVDVPRGGENDEAIAALIRRADEKPQEVSEPPPKEENSFNWLSTNNDSFAPYQKFLKKFFNTTSVEERIPMVLPTDESEQRLREYANHALFDQNSTLTFGKSFCTGEDWISADVFLPAFGFRPIIILEKDGEPRIDLDAFIAYNPLPYSAIPDQLANRQQVTYHVLATISSTPTEAPGDILVSLWKPNDTLRLDAPIQALLSKFDSTPHYIIKWLGNQKYLPFTVTLEKEDSTTTTSAFRITKIRADAWTSGHTANEISLSPP